MKIAILIVATAGLIVLCSVANIGGEPKRKSTTSRAALSMPANLTPMTLLAMRTMLMERKKASRQQLQKSLPLHEKRLQDQAAELEIKKKLYEKDLISKLELENSERAVSPVEEGAGEEAKRPAVSTRRRHRARAGVIRYDSAASWSVDGIEKIENFYRKRFGRPLPISALGQSLTHDRLGLDHRDAVDIAVRPDSAEGRGLMAYLRRAGIPFIAFRGKISSVSTGAHIHIGRPSPRLVEVRQHSKHPEEPDQGAKGG